MANKKITKEAPKKIETSNAPSARAVAKHLRISPRKVRLVIDVIRFKPVGKAFGLLMTLKKKAARMTEKLLKSAVANAKVLQMDEQRLYIAEIRADGGPTMKRFMSRSMGRADRILKRSTHISLVLKEGLKKSDFSMDEIKQEKQEKTKPEKSGKAKASSKKKLTKAGA